MVGCCDPGGHENLFDARYSGRLAKRYRERGLDKTAARMVAFLTERGVEGASVLEIGGGMGAIQLELLHRGAARATNLELVDSYETDAVRAADAAGFGDRVTRRRLDLARRPDDVEPHDIVVLHRVVCCYRDYERLLGAAASHSTRLLVFSHPPRNLVSRAIFGGENLELRLRRLTFRTYVHDPKALTAAACVIGHRPTYRHHGLGWHVAGLERAPASPNEAAR
jgi:magnesium-protoporphyrin O-methyltransferase